MRQRIGSPIPTTSTSKRLDLLCCSDLPTSKGDTMTDPGKDDSSEEAAAGTAAWMEARAAK
jgi:hypothetical protein